MSDLEQFLVERDLARTGEPQVWTVLSGGVSSDIWRVDLPGRSLCVKRALPKLRVKDDWEAPADRNLYEWRWFQTVRRWIPDAAPEWLDQILRTCAHHNIPCHIVRHDVDLAPRTALQALTR